LREQRFAKRRVTDDEDEGQLQLSENIRSCESKLSRAKTELDHDRGQLGKMNKVSVCFLNYILIDWFID
jgi:hypothetical protein